jgi:hypothetical protein
VTAVKTSNLTEILPFHLHLVLSSGFPTIILVAYLFFPTHDSRNSYFEFTLPVDNDCLVERIKRAAQCFLMLCGAFVLGTRSVDIEIICEAHEKSHYSNLWRMTTR